eukprot:1086752_1
MNLVHMNGFVLFALMMLVSPLNVMAAMGSKNASVTEDERQQYIVPGFVRESQNAYSNYVPDGVVRTIDKFYVDKIRESTSEIIDNFAKRFSAILKQFDEIQNVLDSPGSSHTSMSRFIPQIFQQLMQNIPFANPVGESAAERLKWVKEVYKEMPEVIGDEGKFNTLLKVLLKMKYQAIGEEFSIRISKNSPNDLNAARDLANECTKAVEKLLGEQIRSLPESWRSSILATFPPSNANDESKTNDESDDIVAPYGRGKNHKNDTGKTVKLKKSNNKRKKKDTTYSGFKRGFLNGSSKKKKKTKNHYVKSTEKNESADYSAEAKHDNESAYGCKKEKKVKKTKKKANEHA